MIEIRNVNNAGLILLMIVVASCNQEQNNALLLKHTPDFVR